MVHLITLLSIITTGCQNYRISEIFPGYSISIHTQLRITYDELQSSNKMISRRITQSRLLNVFEVEATAFNFTTVTA
jgi:hypothetical protein